MGLNDMGKIRQIKYNKMYCTKCGEDTSADLVGFNFSKIFGRAIEQQENNIWKPLVNIDLKFYYTIRDVCQELHFKLDHNKTSELFLTVGQVIKQLEFLMKPTTFTEMKNSQRNTQLYNNIYETIPSNHKIPNEKMNEIEILINTLSNYHVNDVITSVPFQFIFGYDDLGNEIPIGIRYMINDELFEEYERVCPNCAQRFDHQAGYHHEFIIGLVGLPQTGKTVYIASLLHQLKKYNDNDFISISLVDDNQNNIYDHIIKDYEGGKAITKTEIKELDKISLVYISVKINKKDFNFVFVDIPGEIYALDSDEALDLISEKRHILKSADMLWYFIEPAMINNRYHNENNTILKKDNNDQLSNLITTLNNLYSKKIPACIILSQCDLLQDDYPILFKPDIDVLNEYLMEDHALNITKMMTYIEETRTFIKKLIGFEASIEEVFEGYAMFAVASYGFDVKAAVVKNKVLRPSMVELPFLWSLANLGCLKAKKIVVNKNMFKKEMIEEIIDKKELYI